jgi:tetratricopeptide (TPR) repeat protein
MPFAYRAFLALIIFSSCSAKNPSEPDIQEFHKAQTLYQNKKFDEALLVAERFHKNFPDFAEGAVLVARIRFFIKDFSGSEKVLREFLKRDSSNPYALMWLGRVVSAQEGRAAESSDIYRKVLASDPDNHFAHYYLGRSLEAEGKLKEAIVEYERSLAAEYQISKVHLHMARLYKDLDMKERADRHKNRVKALGVSENDIEAVSSL